MASPVGNHPYYASARWKEKRVKVFARARGMCERCRKKKAVHVHHRSYRFFMNEPLGDLQAVCWSCHMRFHPKVRKQIKRERKEAAPALKVHAELDREWQEIVS